MIVLSATLAQAAISFSSLVTPNDYCVVPQQTVDLFRLTIAQDTDTYRPDTFFFYIESLSGVTSDDFDTIVLRRDNTLTLIGHSRFNAHTTGPGDSEVHVGSGAENMVEFENGTPESIGPGQSQSYTISVKMSDTAAFGNTWRAGVDQGKRFLFGRFTVGGDTTSISASTLLTGSIRVCGGLARNAVPQSLQDPISHPLVAGAGSDYIPVIGFTLGSGDADDRIKSVTLRWVDSGETFNFRPGHANILPNPAFGDLRDVSVWFDGSGDGKFSSTADQLIKSRSRKTITTGVVADPDDPDGETATLEFIPSRLRPPGHPVLDPFIDSPVYRYKIPFSSSAAKTEFVLPTALSTTLQQTNRSNYFIAVRLNQDGGYGEAGGQPGDGLPPGFVSYGDEWNMVLENVEVLETRFKGTSVSDNENLDIGWTVQENLLGLSFDSSTYMDTKPRPLVFSDTVFELSHNPRYQHRLLDFYFDQSPSGELERSDIQDLDFIGQPVYGLYTIAGPANTSFGERIHSFTIVFEDSYGLFYDPTVRPTKKRLDNNFRPISGSSADGIQIWRNANDNPSIDAATDIFLPLDQFNSTWKDPGQTGKRGVWEFRGVIKTPHVLPIDISGNQSASPVPGYYNVDAGNNENPQYWIVYLSSKNGQLNDHIVHYIPDGGIEYSSGNLNQQRASHTPHSLLLQLVNFRPELKWNVPVVWTDFTSTGQIIGQSSPATGMLGLDMNQGNQTFQDTFGGGVIDALLNAMTLYVVDEGSNPPKLAQNDFLGFTNETEAVSGGVNPILKSGFAIYKDHDGAPGNRNGFFDPGIDTPLLFKNIHLAPQPETGTGWVTVGNPGVPALRLQMVFSETQSRADMFLPVTDSGVTLGPDYFIVMRTSSSISGEDRFRVVMGDISTSDGIRSNLTFTQDSQPFYHRYLDIVNADMSNVANQAFFAPSGGAAGLPPFTNGLVTAPTNDQQEYSAFMGATMTTSKVTIGTISSTLLVDNIPPAFTVDREDTFGAVGINMLDGTAGTIQLLEVQVDAVNLGGFSASEDLFSMADQATAGVALYLDTGTKGQFDSKDSRVVIEPLDVLHQTDLGGGSRRYVLRPINPLSVPDDDTTSANVGIDLWVVLRSSSKIKFGDSFSVRIPKGGVIYSSPTQNSNDTLTTNIVSAKVNATIRDYTVSPKEPIEVGVKEPVFGIHAADQLSSGVNGGVLLSTVKVLVYPDTSFSLADLFSSLVFPQTSGGTTGINIYQDNSDSLIGKLDDGDSALTARVEWLGGPPYQMLLTITGGDSRVPDTDDGSDSGPDFFVVFNASSTALNDDAFTVAIPSGGISFTAASSALIDTSVVLVVTGATQQTEYSPASGIFSPNRQDGVRDTMEIRVALPVAVTDSRSILLVLYHRNLSSGETALTRTGFGVDTKFILTNADSSVWLQKEYGVRVYYQDNLLNESQPLSLTTSLVVDSFAPKPSFVSPASSSTTNTVNLQIVADLTSEAGADANATSANIAALATENKEGFNLRIRAKQSDSLVELLSETSTAQTTDYDKTHTLNMPFTGVNTVYAIFRDLSGHEETATTSITVSAVASATPLLTMTDANGNQLLEPVFRYTANNQSLGFTFQENLKEGGIELYTVTGERIHALNATAGSPVIRWDARNAKGTLIRNGVYLARIRVTFESGKSVNQVRTLFLLK